MSFDIGWATTWKCQGGASVRDCHRGVRRRCSAASRFRCGQRRRRSGASPVSPFECQD